MKTEVNRESLRRGRLRVEWFSRGYARLDIGTTDSPIRGDDDVGAIEHRHGLRIA
jgi:glucose-1-phosphate thymidylyltransferase